jgi:hypothetical protein
MTAPTLLDLLAHELEAADPGRLDRLAEQLSPLLDRLAARRGARQRTEPEPERWLTAKDAAAYLAITPAALHKHTAARTIPFEQDGPGCKLWFRRSDLDAWRRGEWRRG